MFTGSTGFVLAQVITDDKSMNVLGFSILSS